MAASIPFNPLCLRKQVRKTLQQFLVLFRDVRMYVLAAPCVYSLTSFIIFIIRPIFPGNGGKGARGEMTLTTPTYGYRSIFSFFKSATEIAALAYYSNLVSVKQMQCLPQIWFDLSKPKPTDPSNTQIRARFINKSTEPITGIHFQVGRSAEWIGRAGGGWVRLLFLAAPFTRHYTLMCEGWC